MYYYYVLYYVLRCVSAAESGLGAAWSCVRAPGRTGWLCLTIYRAWCSVSICPLSRLFRIQDNNPNNTYEAHTYDQNNE